MASPAAMLARRLRLHRAALAAGGALGLAASTQLCAAGAADGGSGGSVPCWASAGAAAIGLAAIAVHRQQAGGSSTAPETLHGRWADGWNAGRYSKAGVGFHRAEVNQHLVAYGHLITSGSSSRVLVPLCGKTVDLLHLATTSDVVGVEGVERAVDEFFTDNPSAGPPSVTASRGGSFKVKVGRSPCELWLGDFFQLDRSELNGRLFNGVWDRASMVAIDPSLREQYAQTITNVLEPGGKVLLSVVEHPPFKDGRLGPPFSIDEAEVRRVYEPLGYTVERLPTLPAKPPPQNATERDLMVEQDYLLTKPSN